MQKKFKLKLFEEDAIELDPLNMSQSLTFEELQTQIDEANKQAYKAQAEEQTKIDADYEINKKGRKQKAKLNSNIDNSDFLDKLQTSGAEASEKFGFQNSWLYQVQLLYNAWLTESEVLKQLNTSGSQLRQQIESGLEVLNQNSNNKNYTLANNYEFNGEHEKVFVRLDEQEKDQPDFIAQNIDLNNDNIIDYIEVKDIPSIEGANSKQLNTHNARLVILYEIKRKKFLFYLKTNKLKVKKLEHYTKLSTELIGIDIPCKTFTCPKDGKSITDVDKQKELEVLNSQIKAKEEELKNLKNSREKLKNEVEKVNKINIKDFN